MASPSSGAGAWGLTPAAGPLAQEVDKQVPDEKRKGKMRTVQEMEYQYEPEMEGAPKLPEECGLWSVREDCEVCMRTVGGA